MKIFLGKYPSWVGPHQIADMLCFWVKEVPDECGIPHKPDWVHNFGTRLAKDKNGNDSWLMKVCRLYVTIFMVAIFPLCLFTKTSLKEAIVQLWEYLTVVRYFKENPDELRWVED